MSTYRHESTIISVLSNEKLVQELLFGKGWTPLMFMRAWSERIDETIKKCSAFWQEKIEKMLKPVKDIDHEKMQKEMPNASREEIDELIDASRKTALMTKTIQKLLIKHKIYKDITKETPYSLFCMLRYLKTFAESPQLNF